MKNLHNMEGIMIEFCGLVGVVGGFVFVAGYIGGRITGR